MRYCATGRRSGFSSCTPRITWVQAARRTLERVVAEAPPYGDVYAYADSSYYPVFQDALARARSASGDDANAAAAYQALLETDRLRPYRPILWVSTLFKLGELEMEAGSEAEGRELLQRFLDYWGEADFELPQVARARALLAN